MRPERGKRKSWSPEVEEESVSRWLVCSAVSKAAKGWVGEVQKIQQPVGSEHPPRAWNVLGSAGKMGSKTMPGPYSHESRWGDEIQQII